MRFELMKTEETAMAAKAACLFIGPPAAAKIAG